VKQHNKLFESKNFKKPLLAGFAFLVLVSAGAVLEVQDSSERCAERIDKDSHFSAALITSGSATGSNAFWTYDAHLDKGTCTFKTYRARIVASVDGPLTFAPKIINLPNSNELLARLRIATPHNLYQNVPACGGKKTSLDFEIYGDTTLLLKRRVMATRTEPLILPSCRIQSKNVDLVTGEKARVTN